MDNYDITQFKSRSEINKAILQLESYYTYGATNNTEKTFAVARINSLRIYKNIYFPKKSLFKWFTSR